MDPGAEDPREIARKLEQATRMVSGVSDPTTYERLKAWIGELREGLRQRQEVRRLNHKIRARARELWEQEGRPHGRDKDHWLRAEAEILAQNKPE